MGTIKILHVFIDDKFFDGVSLFFDKLNNVDNIYAYYSQSFIEFKYIKLNKKIKIISDFNQYKSLFSDKNIDVIYFHSLSPKFYKLFKYINKEKIVIWWCWGYDIYNSFAFKSPLIKVSFYKDKTKQISRNSVLNIKYFLTNLFRIFKYPTYFFYREKIINRIDYFSPVLPVEYFLMKDRNPYFKAKPFMLNSGPGVANLSEFKYKTHVNNLLLGNSFTKTNNHLDVVSFVNNIKLDSKRKIIVPVNYGDGYCNIDILKQSFNKTINFVLLKNFLPKQEYLSLLDSVTHAIFGVMRQQAMFNIFYCLRNSVKVYLFKDSLVYKSLKSSGYYVFTIDDDLNTESINTLISEEQAYHNFLLEKNKHKDKLKNTELELQRIVGNR